MAKRKTKRKSPIRRSDNVLEMHPNIIWLGPLLALAFLILLAIK